MDRIDETALNLLQVLREVETWELGGLKGDAMDALCKWIAKECPIYNNEPIERDAKGRPVFRLLQGDGK